jgi:hypothetical protein
MLADRERSPTRRSVTPRVRVLGRALPVRGVRVEAFFGARGFELVVFGSVLVNVVGLQRSENEPS